MNREYAKQTMDEIIFLPSNSLSMYFVPPVPRGLNRYVPVLWKAGIPAYCSDALKSAFPVYQWHVGFKARKIRWRVRTGFTPVSLFTSQIKKYLYLLCLTDTLHIFLFFCIFNYYFYNLTHLIVTVNTSACQTVFHIGFSLPLRSG